MLFSFKIPMQNAKNKAPSDYGKSKGKEKHKDYSEQRKQKRGE